MADVCCEWCVDVKRVECVTHVGGEWRSGEWGKSTICVARNPPSFGFIYKAHTHNLLNTFHVFDVLHGLRRRRWKTEKLIGIRLECRNMVACASFQYPRCLASNVPMLLVLPAAYFSFSFFCNGFSFSSWARTCFWHFLTDLFMWIDPLKCNVGMRTRNGARWKGGQSGRERGRESWIVIFCLVVTVSCNFFYCSLPYIHDNTSNTQPCSHIHCKCVYLHCELIAFLCYTNAKHCTQYNLQAESAMHIVCQRIPHESTECSVKLFQRI